MEVLGRLTPCPNCGQLVSGTLQTPLPPRSQPTPLTTPEDLRSAPRAAVYRPPEPVERPTNWLPATLIILGVFIGIFFIAYLAMLKVSSYAVQPAPPPPPPPAPTPAPPPSADDEKQSKLFSFNDQSTPSNPTSPAKVTTAPVAPTRPVDPLMEPAPKPTSTSAPSKPAAPLAFAVVPATVPAAEAVTDEKINDAILKGVNFLISRFDEKQKLKADRGGHAAGAHALVTLALLHASQAVSVERLNIHNPFMIGLLEQLKKYEIPDNPATYSRSLRVQALAFHYRTEDRAVLASDTRWLINSSVQGAYGYGPPTAGATQPSQTYWDNSNSQYGVLGVWAAADAGLAVPGNYWTGVQSHWERTQLGSGGWGYTEGDAQGAGTLSMTAAGVNMLFVANEQLSALRPDTQLARPPFSPSLQLGLDWLAKGDNAITLTGQYPWYTLYGMERAGLASGFKMFGRHDWFRDLAADTLKKQGKEGEFGDEVDTAFALLFLSRGRHPLLMNKLHFIGAWANRPRDVANLAKFVSKETERPLNFQVVSLKSEWSDWMDCPILYLSSHEPPIFDESDFAKLKQFVTAGGLLFTHADGGTREFNQFAEMLAFKLFDQDLKDLPPDHFVYNALFKPSEPFPLRGVGNATRTFMIHSPTDISKRWVAKGASSDRPVYELGANLFVYSTGMQVPRNRLDTIYVDDLPGKPKTIVPIARLKYAGDWDPEPWAWERERRMFRRETSIGLAPFPVEIEKLSPSTAPLAHLTGTVAVTLTPAQVKALHDYVAAGGVLLIDACGGSQKCAASLRAALFPAADAQPAPLKLDHPLLAGRGPGMTPLLKQQVRPFVFKALGSKFPPIAALNVGKGAVIFSDLDLTSGLLGTNTLGIVGYDPAYAHAFVRNTILWTINGRGPVTPWNDPPVQATTTSPATTTAAP
jgi:hypothetical protein